MAEIVRGNKIPWDESSDIATESDTSHSAQSNTEIQQNLVSVSESITCLFRLSMAIKTPASHDELMFPAEPDTYEQLSQDRTFLQTSFPHADDYVIERLAKAMNRRRRHIAYRKTSIYKADDVWGGDSEVDLNVFLPGEVTIDTKSDADSSDVGFVGAAADSTEPWFPPMPEVLQPSGGVSCSICHTQVSLRTGREQKDWRYVPEDHVMSPY